MAALLPAGTSTRCARLAVCLLVALGMAVVGAPRANAYDFEWDVTVDHEWGAQGSGSICEQNYPPTATGCFIRYGDWLGIADIANDGYSVGIHWQTDYGRRGVCINPHGRDGVDGFTGGFSACNKNMLEGHEVRVRVGRCDGSEHSCRVLANWENWSGWSPWIVN